MASSNENPKKTSIPMYPNMKAAPTVTTNWKTPIRPEFICFTTKYRRQND
jgi:hypothetical protein